MRKILFILITILFTGCSKNDFDAKKYLYENYLQDYAEYIKSFKIKNTDGLILTNIGEIQGDTTKITLSGIRDKKIWFGKFDKINKEQLFEWNDTEYLPQNREKRLPDGSIQNIPIAFAYAGGPIIYVDSAYVFMIYMGRSIYTTDFADICFFYNNEVVKIKSTIETFTKIHVWIDNTILVEGAVWSCFASNGEKLYAFHEEVKAGTPINTEECINESLSGLQRVNLKTGEIKWKTDKLYQDLPDSSKALIYKVSAKSQIWEYNVLLSSGDIRVFEININSGEIAYK